MKIYHFKCTFNELAYIHLVDKLAGILENRHRRSQMVIRRVTLDISVTKGLISIYMFAWMHNANGNGLKIIRFG